jgi:hypothetical protein
MLLAAIGYILIGMKLAGLVALSWWLVSAPIWVPITAFWFVCAALVAAQIVDDLKRYTEE